MFYFLESTPLNITQCFVFKSQSARISVNLSSAANGTKIKAEVYLKQLQ